MKMKHVTRRQMLQTLGAGAVVAGVGAVLPGVVASVAANSESPIPEARTKQAVTPLAVAFDLAGAGT
jgi:anaerobic selenocysteine-containing dehydrogenase